ncbi:Histidine kinase domain-containing protein, double Cache 2 and HAMP and PAS domains-containing [Desulfonema limicola]|uniref:histidine kinase n=1 Tax=Desulfonema limicola TaxID=45656 RepID=A0A975GGQ4_9BACT|nr:cache domain-containing protein [Desulfonema limicola]QTA80576.1 Histidine kinase domain-containing protein, double Cache 2 and HAMP and PAS domains-containing [Desulfonema limicola]
MKIFDILHNLRIQYKLFFSYTAVFIITIMLGSIIIYSIAQQSIESNIESELKNSTNTILNMVRTSAAVSLKNYFRAAAEKNKDVAAYFYHQFQQGILTEQEAKQEAANFFHSQTIGASGYIYCIDSSGVIKVHPQKALVEVNISEYNFAREQKKNKTGYLEYDWKNPGEESERPKALYMSYFQEWDWIISVTSYREEFSELVNIDDFRQSILSLKFGHTGYSYVMDLNGNLIIHPELEGENVMNEKDADGRLFIQEVCRLKKGKISYPWKNPHEAVAREKLVIFNYIPEYNWIVFSSSYLDELYAPLKTIKNAIFFSVVVSILLLFPISLMISSSITNPLGELMKQFASVPDGDFTFRIQPKTHDEIGRLAVYFNSFMERLQSYSNNLRQEIFERRQAEQALRLSEEMFSKAFDLSPSGIAILSWDDKRFININASFLTNLRCMREDILNKSLKDLDFFLTPSGYEEMFATLKITGSLNNYEVQSITKSGESRLALISSDFIELWNEHCILLTHKDITEIRLLENKIMDISEKERRKIGQDLHDDLCPHLIGIEVLTKVLQYKLESEYPKLSKSAGNIRNLIKDAITKTRGMSRGLCPIHLVEHGFEFSIKELARNTEHVFGISCIFKCLCPVVFHDNSDATHLYYIIQEAVYNAIKHGKASRIIIDLSLMDGKMILKIIDDGCTISNISHTKGMGLKIMGFRAKKIGASFDISPNKGQGTTITVTFRKDMQKAGISYA